LPKATRFDGCLFCVYKKYLLYQYFRHFLSERG
jgi:hypothetical protein